MPPFVDSAVQTSFEESLDESLASNSHFKDAIHSETVLDCAEGDVLEPRNTFDPKEVWTCIIKDTIIKMAKFEISYRESVRSWADVEKSVIEEFQRPLESTNQTAETSEVKIEERDSDSDSDATLVAAEPETEEVPNNAEQEALDSLAQLMSQQYDNLPVGMIQPSKAQLKQMMRNRLMKVKKNKTAEGISRYNRYSKFFQLVDCSRYLTLLCRTPDAYKDQLEKEFIDFLFSLPVPESFFQ